MTGRVMAVGLIVFGAATAWAEDEETSNELGRWLNVDLNHGVAGGGASQSHSTLRLMLGGRTGISVVTDAGGDAPSAAAAVLPRSDRLAQQEISRHSDAEIGLAIGITKGVDLVPAYGLHWTGNEAEGIETDVSHRFTFGARIGF